MLETSLVALGLVLLTQVVKKVVEPKWGATGTQVFVFAVALAVVVVKSLMTSFPGFGAMVITAGQYLVGAIAIYEVVVKKVMPPKEEV